MKTVNDGDGVRECGRERKQNKSIMTIKFCLRAFNDCMWEELLKLFSARGNHGVEYYWSARSRWGQ
jgi:hypothetical protein